MSRVTGLFPCTTASGGAVGASDVTNLSLSTHSSQLALLVSLHRATHVKSSRRLYIVDVSLGRVHTAATWKTNLFGRRSLQESRRSLQARARCSSFSVAACKQLISFLLLNCITCRNRALCFRIFVSQNVERASRNACSHLPPLYMYTT